MTSSCRASDLHVGLYVRPAFPLTNLDGKLNLYVLRSRFNVDDDNNSVEYDVPHGAPLLWLRIIIVVASRRLYF